MRDTLHIARDFLREVAGHELTIYAGADPGRPFRLHFQKPRSSPYWFEIITWPYHLAITGDCGNFLFRHFNVPDMVTFFRDKRHISKAHAMRSAGDGLSECSQCSYEEGSYGPGSSLACEGPDPARWLAEGINLPHWAEKLVAIDKGGLKHFDERAYREAIRCDLEIFLVDRTPAEADDLRQEVARELLADIPVDQREAVGRALDFTWTNPVSGKRHWPFEGFYEHDVTEYDLYFVWCALALVWGIGRYEHTLVEGLRNA